MEICEICNERKAETICIRCRRPICSSCESPQAMLCKECYEFKRALEEQRELMVNYIEKMTKLSSLKLKNSECLQCNILREFLLSLYKMLKELIDEANRELFNEVLNRGREIEKRLKKLLLTVLTLQGLSISERD